MYIIVSNVLSFKFSQRAPLLPLGSTNGTYLNGERIEPQRYYQLLEKDTVKFGTSTREYVILNDESA